jgi:hypothetical protein
MVRYFALNFGYFLLLTHIWLLPGDLCRPQHTTFPMSMSQQHVELFSQNLLNCLQCSLAKLLSTSWYWIRRFVDLQIHVSFCKMTHAVVQFRQLWFLLWSCLWILGENSGRYYMDGCRAKDPARAVPGGQRTRPLPPLPSQSLPSGPGGRGERGKRCKK